MMALHFLTFRASASDGALGPADKKVGAGRIIITYYYYLLLLLSYYIFTYIYLVCSSRTAL